MRMSALANRLKTVLGTHSARKPRRTVLGVDQFRDRIVPAALSGAVYQDLNHNGLRDAGEPGIANVRIHLVGKTDCGQTVVKDATTDCQGNYSFTGLASGTYMLVEWQPGRGFTQGSATVGTHGGTAKGPDVIQGIDVCGCDGTGYNFGEYPKCDGGGDHDHDHERCDDHEHDGRGDRDDDCGCEHQKGNNGVGNGLDPQPPGDPRINDGPGTSPGNPGNRGGK